MISHQKLYIGDHSVVFTPAVRHQCPVTPVQKGSIPLFIGPGSVYQRRLIRSLSVIINSIPDQSVSAFAKNTAINSQGVFPEIHSLIKLNSLQGTAPQKYAANIKLGIIIIFFYIYYLAFLKLPVQPVLPFFCIKV